MSDSEGDVIPRAKKRRYQKLKSSSEESDSDNHDEPVLKKPGASKTAKCESSEDEKTPRKDAKTPKTPATRSSDRLKAKNSREFRLPSRDEVLDEVSPGNIICPRSSERKIKELRPRRLVNNFIRECNSYAADRAGDIYSTDSSFSDFIADSDEDEEEEGEDSASDDLSTSSSGKDFLNAKKKKPLKRRKKNISSDSDSGEIKSKKGKKSKEKTIRTRKNSTKCNKKNAKKETKNTRTRSSKLPRQKKVIVSDESESDSTSDDDENVPLSTFVKKRPNSLKKKKVLTDSSESEDERDATMQDDNYSSNEQGEKTFTKLKDYSSRPKSSRRLKLIQKQQECYDKKYGEFLKRKTVAKQGPKDPKMESENTSNQATKEKLNNSDEGLQTFKELIENWSESDEDDKDFVVSDNEVSEEEIISDQELDIKFLKFINDHSQTEDTESDPTLNSPTSGFSVQTRRKGKRIRNSFSKWRRINDRVESDDSSDSETKIKEDYDHDCQLHAAVNQNDIALVKKLLQQDPSVIYTVGYRQRSVLHLAALNGNPEMVQLLIKMKAECEVLDKYDFPSIAYAANGHSECLKIFLRHMNIKQVNSELIQTDSKMSLLHFAVGETRMGTECTERGKCLELLFAHDKNLCMKMLEHRDARRRTPLQAAVFASQHQCAAILLKHGADTMSYRTKEGGNLLHFAVECASHLKQASVEDKDTSLCLRQLVEPMALYLNKTDENGFTPLMYACETGNDECAAALIQAGATLMTKDSHGTSPLHLAAIAGSTECVNLLLKNGHQVDCVDNCGWPPLLYANFKAQEECVLALMNPKPDQLFVLGHLLKKQRNEEEKKKTMKVVKNVLFSLANHDAYYTVFNDFIRVNPSVLDESDHGLLQHTWRAILDFDNKHKWFKRRLEPLRRNDYYSTNVSLRVKRDDILGSTMKKIGQRHGRELRSGMNVLFEDEPGICTGPKREFFACLCKDVVDPKRGLFDMSDDSQFSPTPNAYFASFASNQPTTLPHSQITGHGHTNTSGKKEEDFVQNVDIECTDSELLAADQTEGNNNSNEALNANEQPEATDSELVSAMDTAVVDSGICSTIASQSQPDSECTDFESSTVSLSTGSSNEANTDTGNPVGAEVNTNTGNPVGAEVNTSTGNTVGAEVNTSTGNAVGAEVNTSTGNPEEATAAPTPVSDSQESEDGSTRHSDRNTWISCEGMSSKDIVIPGIALRSKLKQLRLIGRLVGAAICQDMLLSLNLAKHFVKQVLGIPLSHPDDLSSFDFELHKSMVTWVQENSVDNLELPFGVDVNNPWTNQPVSVNFSDDEDKTVDDSNKHEYVKLVSQYKLQTFIEKEVEEFSLGLYEVFPRELLSFFTADEFSLLMNGVTKIDVKDWKENTQYQGFSSSDQIITWFWDIVSRLKEEEKALLLKFSTGSPSVPIGGFANLQGLSGPNKFIIAKLFGSNKIPQASTCFNMLKLTDYDSEKQLREKLLIAIRHGSEGFSFS